MKVSRQYHEAVDSPQVITKCGTIKPTLVSHKQKTRARDFTIVPPIVHYVSIGAYEFSFLHYLSVLSAHKFIQPKFMYFHGDVLPVGYWWNR